MDFITKAIATAIERGPARRPAQARDGQRSKVYAAEDAAFDKAKSEGMTVEEVEAFVAWLWRSYAARKAMIRNGPSRAWRQPRVADGRGCRRASAGGGVVTIPRWARSRWVVCHEVAHEIVIRGPWHGPEFCRTYLELIEEALGFEARERLGLEMRKRNVKTR